jgi:hypothetical protein
MLEISCDEFSLDDIEVQNAERFKASGIDWDNISGKGQ